ncbi:MAG: zinc ribbon domain-containing protein [Spirochaetales bacterium]|nr:zinc ribbon domain-containing protein [Spirochaetales bacterium]
MEQTICQRCSMPMTDESLFGTEKDGSKNSEYCKYCYTDGQVVNPGQTLEEMIDFCVPLMVQEGMEEKAARNHLNSVLPNLKHWKNLKSQ